MVALSKIPFLGGLLDGRRVEEISRSLEELDTVGSPVQLPENLDRSFEGFKLTGEGFIIDRDEALRLLAADPRNAEVVRPYLIADDITKRPDESPSRWAIDFGVMDLEEARTFTEPMRIVETRVKPKRMRATRRADRERWWRYGEARPRLRACSSGLGTVIVIGALAKWLSVSRQPQTVIYSNRVFVIADDSYATFGSLCSSFHESWTRQFSGRLEDRLIYNPTVAFRTFPFAAETPELEMAGRRFEEIRSVVMKSRGIGMNSLGNLMHDPACDDKDIQEIRDALTRLDDAVRIAYGWEDIALEHGFHPNQGLVRFTLSPACWKEVKARLIQENHQRARAHGIAPGGAPAQYSQETFLI